MALSYSGFIGRVEEIGAVGPGDRIGIRLREEGFTEPDDFSGRRTFVIDMELWDLGRRDVGRATTRTCQVKTRLAASGLRARTTS